MQQITPNRVVGMVAALALLVAGDARAALLYAQGEAGNFGTIAYSVGPSATGPITLPSGELDVGGRYADFSALVAPGVIQLMAFAGADVGAQSVGNWNSRASGSWEDTIMFTGSIPGFPGVDIALGTPGTAVLVVDLTGVFGTDAGGNSAIAGYQASLGYGELAPFEDRCCGPKWTVFGGEDNLWGERNGSAPPTSAFSGDPLPNQLRLNVAFEYDVPFDVIFELSIWSEVGWEGIATEELVAAAFLDQSAIWQGPQNVTADVDDGFGGIMQVAIPDGSFSFASDTFDYSTPAAVPEPSTAVLLGFGLVALALRGRIRS